MPAMDSRISLALAVKLKMIFQGDQTFLSFPMGHGFTYDSLGFMDSLTQPGTSALDQLNAKAQFARQLNIIPDDNTIFEGDASRMLWDAVIQILNQSEVATSALTAEEEKKLSDAIDFLTDIQKLDDGTEVPVNSVKVVQYTTYAGIYDQTQNTYINEKITVEFSTGEQGEILKKQWAEYREAQLKTLVNKAMNDWENLGFKNEVESMQALRNLLEPKKMLILYKQAYLNDISISEIVDTQGQGIESYNTFYNPSDVFRKDTLWPSLTLNRSEINQLVKNAPEELKVIFDSGSASDEIELVSLEYNNVSVIRPWFHPEFFSSRFWRLPANEKISDGKIPAGGTIPAFISSMLVLRNITVTRRKTITNQPFLFPIIIKDSVTPPKPFIPKRKVPRATAGDDIKREKVMAVPLKEIKDIPAMMNKTSFVRAVGGNTIDSRKKIELTKYRGAVVPSPVINIPPDPNAPKPPPTETVTETLALDGVQVMAYLCHRIGECPNPDLTLKW